VPARCQVGVLDSADVRKCTEFLGNCHVLGKRRNRKVGVLAIASALSPLAMPSSARKTRRTSEGESSFRRQRHNSHRSMATRTSHLFLRFEPLQSMRSAASQCVLLGGLILVPQAPELLFPQSVCPSLPSSPCWRPVYPSDRQTPLFMRVFRIWHPSD